MPSHSALTSGSGFGRESSDVTLNQLSQSSSYTQGLSSSSQSSAPSASETAIIVTQLVSAGSVSAGQFSGGTKQAFDRGYATLIGIWDTGCNTANCIAYKPGCTLRSSVHAGRRMAYITFTASVSASLASSARASAETFTPADLAMAVNSAAITTGGSSLVSEGTLQVSLPTIAPLLPSPSAPDVVSTSSHVSPLSSRVDETDHHADAAHSELSEGSSRPGAQSILIGVGVTLGAAVAIGILVVVWVKYRLRISKMPDSAAEVSFETLGEAEEARILAVMEEAQLHSESKSVERHDTLECVEKDRGVDTAAFDECDSIAMELHDIGDGLDGEIGVEMKPQSYPKSQPARHHRTRKAPPKRRHQ